jgi:hypothetical protein
MPPSIRPLRSDLETLRLLLECASLPATDAAPFKQMHEELVSGKRADLNEAERASVQSAFDRYDVANFQYSSRKDSYKKAQDRVIAAFEAMPRPKRPPGK